jgi:hypothetical protein
MYLCDSLVKIYVVNFVRFNHHESVGTPSNKYCTRCEVSKLIYVALRSRWKQYKQQTSQS